MLAKKKPAARKGSRKPAAKARSKSASKGPTAQPRARAGSKKPGVRPGSSRTVKKPSTRARPARRAVAATDFPKALAELLRSRGLRVPAGLQAAPPDAYAHEPASVVDSILSRLSNEELFAHAEKVAGWAARQAMRARAAWESSPLITEIRRRRLAVPDAPKRVVAFAISLKKPLAEWTDRELARAASEWSRRGR